MAKFNSHTFLGMMAGRSLYYQGGLALQQFQSVVCLLRGYETSIDPELSHVPHACLEPAQCATTTQQQQARTCVSYNQTNTKICYSAFEPQSWADLGARDIVVASHDSSHTLSTQRVDSIVAAAIRSAAQLIWMGEVCAESSVTKHRIWPNKIPVLHVAPYTQHLCSSGCLRGAHFDHWNAILFSYLLHNLKRFPTDGAFNYHYNRTFVDQDDMAIHFESRGSMLQALVPPGSRVAELGVLVCHILLTLTHSLPQRS